MPSGFHSSWEGTNPASLLSLPSCRGVCGKTARESDRILAWIQMMSYNDCLKASAIGTGRQTGKGVLTVLCWDYVRYLPCGILSTQHWRGWQVMSIDCTVWQQAALAEPVLFCLPWLIATATGSCAVWVQSLALAFLCAALNNCSVSPPSLSKWEEGVKDGKEDCLFELGSVHCSWAPNTHTHANIHTVPLVTFQKTPNCCFLQLAFFSMTRKSLISWEIPSQIMWIFSLNECCGAILTIVNRERSDCGHFHMFVTLLDCQTALKVTLVDSAGNCTWMIFMTLWVLFESDLNLIY